jgi:hypothetical protein
MPSSVLPSASKLVNIHEHNSKKKEHKQEMSECADFVLDDNLQQEGE